MKTAVSIPDTLFERAEKAAKKKKMSRSRLYAVALQLYLSGDWRDEMTRRTNEVCDQVDTSMPPEMERAIVSRLREVEW